MTELCWTTDAPQVPGYYWYRTEALQAVILLVELVSDVMVIRFPDDHLVPTRSLSDGEWAGPLQPPSERH